MNAASNLPSAKLYKRTVWSAPPVATRAPFFETATAWIGLSLPSKARSLAPVEAFHSFTLPSAPAVSTCAPSGVGVTARIGEPTATDRDQFSVSTVTVLSAPPATMAGALGRKATTRTAPACGNDWISWRVAASQTRARPSAPAVAIFVLSALNDRPATSAGWVSVNTSLPSATVHALTVLPAAAPTSRPSLLTATAVTASGSGPNVLTAWPVVRFQSLTVLSAPPETACTPSGR